MPIPAVVRRNTFLLATFQCMLWISLPLTPTLGSIIVFQLTDNKSLAGLASTLTYISGAAGVLWGGRLIDRYGRRPILILASVIGLAGATIIGFSVASEYLAGFLGGLLLFGAGTTIGQLARSAAADMFPPDKRGLGISFVVVGGTVGAIVGPLLVAPLSNYGKNIGWNPLALPWVLAPIALAIGMVALFLVRPDPREIASNLGRYYPDLARPPAPGKPRALAILLRLPPCQVSIVAVAMLQANMVLVMTIMALILTTRGWTMGVISILMAIHFVGMFGFSVVAGRLADSLGRRNVMVAGCVISAVGCLLSPFSQSLLVTGVGFFMIGLGWSLGYVGGTTAMADVTQPLERGSLLGFNDLVMSLSSAGVSILAGILLALSSFEVVGFLGFLMGLFPIALALRLREERPGVYTEITPAIEVPVVE